MIQLFYSHTKHTPKSKIDYKNQKNQQKVLKETFHKLLVMDFLIAHKKDHKVNNNQEQNLMVIIQELPKKVRVKGHRHQKE